MTKTQGKNIIVCTLTVLIYFLWSYLVSGLTSLFNLQGNIKLWISALIFAILLLIYIIVYHRDLKTSLKNLKKDFLKNNLSSLKIFFLGYSIYFIISTLINVFFPDIFYVNNTLEGFRTIPVLAIFFMLIYYPIIEELVFKLSFKKIITNKWSFVIITGFLNAFFQVALSATNTISLIIILSDTIFYMTLSYIYFETDNIFISIFYRMLSNILPVIATCFSIAGVFLK